MSNRLRTLVLLCAVGSMTALAIAGTVAILADIFRSGYDLPLPFYALMGSIVGFFTRVVTLKKEKSAEKPETGKGQES